MGPEVPDGRGDPGRPGDPGRYGPASEAWRLNREAMLLLGAGPRALLLQLAHPAVAAGVADHSDFRADPWRRLAGTLRSYLTIVYGTTAAANAEIRRLNTLHRGIVGPGYSARDPALSLWVHATLVDSTMAVYDAWLEPLPATRREAFYAETRPIGRAFGVPEDDAAGGPRRRSRRTWPRCSGRWARSACRRSRGSWPGSCCGRRWRPSRRSCPGRTRGWPRCCAGFPPAAYAWTLWPSVGLLPVSVREDYGLAWGRRERAVSGWLVAGWRGWRPLLPAGFRQMPKALAADRRVDRYPPHGS